MNFKIQLVIDDERGTIKMEEIIHLEKRSGQRNQAGLSLSESKKLLTALQAKIVLSQAEEYTQSKKYCADCSKKRKIKGYHLIHFRTLFGIIEIPSVRFYHCDCEHMVKKTFSPLEEWFSEHTSPEFQYLETKWASLMSYGLTTNLLKDILPIDKKHNAATVHNHLYKTAKRQEAELIGKPEYTEGCPMEWGELPKPGKPLTVGIDGGYLKGWEKKNSNFEVIAGKSYSETQAPKRFGFVQSIDNKPRRRLMNVLSGQSMQANQSITFLSDGADNVRDLQYMMYPESEHILDWFHITMRLTVLSQFSKGLVHSDPEEGKEMTKDLESIKWYLWHGNVEKALGLLEDCSITMDNEELHYHARKKFLKHLEEMDTYIENNQHLIPNYGERWRYGEAISSAFIESTINEVVSKRMVKKQQMQWTSLGAHYLLQTRTAVLNNELQKHFERWYPGIGIEQNDEKKEVIALPEAA